MKLNVVAFVVFFNVTFVVSNIINTTVDKSATSTINQKFVMLFNIIIYNTLFVVEVIASIAKVFFNFWKKNEFTVNLSLDNWIFIMLKFDATLTSFKIYFVDQMNKNFINKKFDKLQRQRKLKYIIQSTSFNYSIFVMWRIIYKSNESFERKNKIIVNIREFNKIIELNIYFMFLQTNIIALIIDCFYIFVFDATSFFY